MRVAEILLALANDLESEDNVALLLSEYDIPSMKVVAEGLIEAASVLKKTAAHVNNIEPYREMNDILDDVVAVADHLDSKGLQKEASVLDELLLTISAPKDAVKKIKQAQEAEFQKIKERYDQQRFDNAYKNPTETFARDENKKEYRDAVNEQVKKYQPLEAPLSTRYSPDFPGVQTQRIADNVYRDPITGAIYDYRSGYTTAKGNKVPGGSVEEQTQYYENFSVPHTVFDNRESYLARFASEDDE